jgi:hypothetical protein
MNVADVAPGCTTTLGGTAAICGALLPIFTVTPAEPAAADNVTVPTAVPPPVTLVGFSVKLDN